MTTLSVSDILLKTNNKSNNEERVAYLKHHSNPTLKKILGYCFDPRVEFSLPPGDLPEDSVKFAAKAEDLQGALYNRARMLDHVLKTPLNKTKQIDRERIFLQLLEGIDRDDAELLISIKDKKLPKKYSKVTKKIVAEAFPGIAKGW